MLHCVVSYKLTYVSEMLTASVMRATSTLMMEAVSTSEISVSLYGTTQRNNPERAVFILAAVENLEVSQPVELCSR
jgi:hypothetical protein